MKLDKDSELYYLSSYNRFNCKYEEKIYRKYTNIIKFITNMVLDTESEEIKNRVKAIFVEAMAPNLLTDIRHKYTDISSSKNSQKYE